MEKNEIDMKLEPSEDKTIFAPIEEIRNFERLIINLEITRRELQKVAEGMKPIKV